MFSRRSLFKEFGEEIFSSDGSILFCKICDKAVNYDKKYFVTQHLAGGRHSNLAAKRSKEKSSTITSLLKPALQAVGKQSQFSLDLCNAFVSSSIPLWKLENPALKDFLRKYTKENVPSESSIRKNYIDVVYQQRMEMIRTAVSENYIWCSIDETTDATGRYVVNVVIGTLDVHHSSKIFLLACETVDKTNSSTISQVFTNALVLLWPNGVQHNRVLLFVTDAAPYMKRAGRALKILFPSMLHVTCLAHAFHRIADEIRRLFPDVDALIANGKKIFLKAPRRVQMLKTVAPNLQMPPQPVITRWGTWISASLYYSKNFEEFKSVIEELDENESASIAITKNLIQKHSVKQELAYIATHFAVLPDGIQFLEKQNEPLVSMLNQVDDLRQQLMSATGNRGEAIRAKCESVIASNPDLHVLRAVSATLQGEIQDNATTCNIKMTPEIMVCFKFAPITSVDVERSFSTLKNILSDRRESLSFENLKKLLIIACNPMQNL